MDGWMDGWMEGWMDGGMGGWMDGGMGGWMDGCVDGWKDGRMEGGMMNSSLVPRLVLEYAAFSSKQGVTKPLVMMGKGIDGEGLVPTSDPEQSWGRHQPSGCAG